MTGHQDGPDVQQRRRVSRLRAELGLTPVPAHVGTELRALAPRIAEQVVRVLRRDPAVAALSSGGQTHLLATVARAAEEFARLVEDRPPRVPTVEAVLVEIVRVEGQLDRCRAALHATFQALREVTLVLWPQLPQARPYSTHLDEALVRYAGRLCARTMNAHRAPAADSTDRRRSSQSPLDKLLAQVRHRWGDQPVQLHLSLSTPEAGAVSSPRVAARPVGVATRDYVVVVTVHPLPRPRPVDATAPKIEVCVGPVPASGIALAHDTALLLLRLIQAGVAAPPSPVLIHAPNLGFLRPSPSEATVQQIATLLLPLSGHGSHRRSALARTLQLCLRTATTAQGLAKQLAMHPQTVHNHITTLRSLYNPNLDFAENTLAMKAALDLVLPLWDLETRGRQSSPPLDERKHT